MGRCPIISIFGRQEACLTKVFSCEALSLLREHLHLLLSPHVNKKAALMNLWWNSCKESVELFLRTSSWLLLTHLKWQGVDRDHKDRGRMFDLPRDYLSVCAKYATNFSSSGKKKEQNPWIVTSVARQNIFPKHSTKLGCMLSYKLAKTEAFSDGGFLITAEATMESLKTFQFEPFLFISVNKHMKLLKRGVDFLCHFWLWPRHFVLLQHILLEVWQ